MRPPQLLELLLAVVLAAPAAGYATLFNAPTAKGVSPFSAAGLATHSTGILDEQQQCPAAPDLPTRLDIAAPERALPKRAAPTEGGDGPTKDPLGLWAPPPPSGPKGPSVFKLNQGRAIDMLRKDYPNVFVQKPDLSIFTSEMELHDPSGRRLKGLKQYEKVFDMLRFLRRTTMQDAQVTYRLVVVDERIRVRWTAKVWLRDPALGLTKMANGEPIVVHLDGVSNYDLDAEGKIYKHTIDNIIMNGPAMAEPVQLAFAWPSLGLATPELALPTAGFLRPLDATQGWTPPPQLKAFFAPPAAEGSARTRATQPIAAQPAKRRGGAPQAMAAPGDETPMERAARERAEDAAKAAQLASMRAPAEEKKEGLFGMTMPQPCDTSYDCERPDVCCDLLFGSFCCSSGLMIPQKSPEASLQRQAIPIPVEADNGGGNAPRYPGGNGGGNGGGGGGGAYGSGGFPGAY